MLRERINGIDVGSIRVSFQIITPGCSRNDNVWHQSVWLVEFEGKAFEYEVNDCNIVRGVIVGEDSEELH